MASTAATSFGCCGTFTSPHNDTKVPTSMSFSATPCRILKAPSDHVGTFRIKLQSRGNSRRSCKANHVTRMSLMGEDPERSDNDFIVLGLAHCFVKDSDSRLQDCFVVEPIPAGAVECMDNGGVTCFKHAYGTRLGTALKQDMSILPAEFQGGKFCEDFEFRTLCASRTWKRQHPQENLLSLVADGVVRSDWNFNLDDKRILNMEHEVNDSDNIKQDMSIDVYGRQEENEEKEVEKLYNV